MELTREITEQLFGPNTGGQFEANLMCIPQDPKWPVDRQMMTMSFGFFWPNEIKRVRISEDSKKLVTNGDFSWVDDPPNSEAINQIVATYRQNAAMARQSKLNGNAPGVKQVVDKTADETLSPVDLLK